jgi:hypothetical protein
MYETLHRGHLIRTLATLASVCFTVACSSASEQTQAEGFPEAPYVAAETDAQKLRLELRSSPRQPPTAGVCAIQVTVQDALGNSLKDLNVRVTPWMPAMGHGTSQDPKVRDLGDGNYVADDVRLFMAGEWQLQISIDGSVKDSATVSFEVR